MKFLGKTDGIIIAAIFALALIFWLMDGFFLTGRQEKVYAEIYYDNQLVFRTELSSAEEQKFSVPGKPNVVFEIFADKSIAFVQSDCPDKVCIHMGRLNKPNQFAACLPNKMMLKTVSTTENDDGPDLIIK